MATNKQQIKSTGPDSRAFIIKKCINLSPGSKTVKKSSVNCYETSNIFKNLFGGNFKVGIPKTSVRATVSNDRGRTGEQSKVIHIKVCNENSKLPKPLKMSISPSVPVIRQSKIIQLNNTSSQEDQWRMQQFYVICDKFKNVTGYKATYKHIDGTEETRDTDNLQRLIGRKNFANFAKTLQSLSDTKMKINLVQSLLTVVKCHKDAATNTDADVLHPKLETKKTGKKQQKPYLGGKYPARIIKESVVGMHKKNITTQMKSSTDIQDQPDEKILNDEAGMGPPPSIPQSTLIKPENESFEIVANLDIKSVISLNQTLDSNTNYSNIQKLTGNRKRLQGRSPKHDKTVKKHCPTNMDNNQSTNDFCRNNFNIKTQLDDNGSYLEKRMKKESHDDGVKLENVNIPEQIEMAHSNADVLVSSLSDVLR